MNLENIVDESVLDVIPHVQDRITLASYFGIQTQRNPWDFWTYQEILFTTRPDVIIEVGVCCGGMTLALAHLCDALGRGCVYGVDVDLSKVPAIVQQHERVQLLCGDGATMARYIAALLDDDQRVMVIEDSAHTYENTLAVLRAYAGLVTPGCYLVCEDSICRHPLPEGPSLGPYEAIATFLAGDDRYESDRAIEPLLTWNPHGYLKRL